MTCADIRNPWLFNFLKTKLKTNRLYIHGDGDEDSEGVGRATGRWHKVVDLRVDNRYGDIIAEYLIKSKREGNLLPFYRNEIIANILLLDETPSVAKEGGK